MTLVKITLVEDEIAIALNTLRSLRMTLVKITLVEDEITIALNTPRTVWQRQKCACGLTGDRR
jgi:hypothetical protein